MDEVSRSFRAMNTDVLAVIAVDPDRRDDASGALDGVETLFADVERCLSRFQPSSELSRLNRSCGAPFEASALLFAVVEDALAAARLTDGLFDPTVLDALETAGYDRSFELLASAPIDSSAPTIRARAAARCAWRDVRVDARRQVISLPVGRGIDLGGIGKGWTVDRAAEKLRAFGNFAVDAGGDLYAAGVQADGTPWTVGVEDPRNRDRDLLVLAVRDRAVATSTVARRRWWRDGRERHHLIDPRTGQPSRSGVVSVTVVADSVARAEILTKAALILGPEEGLRFLDRQPGVAGLLVLDDGRSLCTAGFHEVQYGA